MSYLSAILANRPGAKAHVNEETGEILEWSGKDKPTPDEVRAWKIVEDAKPRRRPPLAELDQALTERPERLIKLLDLLDGK